MIKLDDYLMDRMLIRLNYNTRFFSGLGRTLNIGNITIDNDLDEYNNDITSGNRLCKSDYTAQIDSNGVLQIYYGNLCSLAKILVPKEHFTILAQRESKVEDKKFYRMLANLQGKELLR